MSIEGSLALAWLVLLALGVAVSARRATLSPTEGMPAASSDSEAAAVDGSPAAASSSNAVSIVLLVAGVVALLAAAAAVIAMWVLFSGRL